MSEPLALVGCGAVTAVGLTAAQTCAAVRAAITGYTLTGVHDTVRGPTLHAEVPLAPRPAEATQFGRLVALAVPALDECVESAGLEAERCALLLIVREPFRAGIGTNWSEAGLLAAIQSASGRTFNGASEVFPHGNAGAFLALERAYEYLRVGRADACVIGGVDSLLNIVDRRRLGSVYRLKSEEVAQGLVPGEGAAFVAVTAFRGLAFGTILGVGVAAEDPASAVVGDAHPIGRGLEEAIRRSVTAAQISESDVDFRVSDMNGETYGGVDRMLAEARVFRTRRERFPQILPAASVGEIGAAAGPLLMIVAGRALARGYAPGRMAMCEASSEGGLRGACVVAGAEFGQ